MRTNDHHVFLSMPGTGALGAIVARSLAAGQAALGATGLGKAVLGPVASGGVHVDETICGRAAAGMEGFFPLAEARAFAFSRKIRGPVGRLVLPMLPLDTLYPKLWRAQAARRAMPAFDALAPHLLAEPRGWFDLVSELIATLAPRETILLVDPTPAEALAALVPEAGLAAPAAAEPELPDTALAMLQRLHRSGITLPARQLSRLAAFHLRQPQPAPIAAFAELDAARLRRQFAADLDQLTGLPCVRVGAAPLPMAIAAE